MGVKFLGCENSMVYELLIYLWNLIWFFVVLVLKFGVVLLMCNVMWVFLFVWFWYGNFYILSGKSVKVL